MSKYFLNIQIISQSYFLCKSTTIDILFYICYDDLIRSFYNKQKGGNQMNKDAIKNPVYGEPEQFEGVLVSIPARPKSDKANFKYIPGHITKNNFSVPGRWRFGAFKNSLGNFIQINFYDVEPGEKPRNAVFDIEIKYIKEKNNPKRVNIDISCRPSEEEAIHVLDCFSNNPLFDLPGSKTGVVLRPLIRKI